MPRTKTTFEMVKKVGLELPDVEEGTSWGSPSLKVRGKFLACMATNKAAEPNSLVVRMDFDQRDALIADDPDTYYLKPHYVGYPSVLVRLDRVKPDALRDLLTTAWRLVRAEVPKGKPSRGHRTRSATKPGARRSDRS